MDQTYLITGDGKSVSKVLSDAEKEFGDVRIAGFVRFQCGERVE